MRFFTLTSLLFAGALASMANVGDLPTNPPTDLILNPSTTAERITLVKSGIGLIRTDDRLDEIPSDGSLTQVVRDGDKIYLNRVFSWNDAPGWIEGTVEGKTVTFQLPQLVKRSTEDVDGIIQVRTYYAVVCEMKMISSMYADMVPTTDQRMSFTINDDGSLVPQNPDLFMGNWEYANNLWEWNMDGDFYTSLNRQNAVPVNAPSDVEMTPMILTYPHLLYGGAYANEVMVGFKDDDCYIRGMAIGIRDLPNATIKGKLENNVVSFDSNQFLGDSWLFGFTQYMIGGETEYIEDSSLQGGYRPSFTPMDRIEFVYDAEKRTLTSDMSFIIVPSLQENPENLYYENVYNTPEIFYADQSGAVEALVTPELISYLPSDEFYPDVIEFAVSMLSKENRILDMEKLYFEIYADGEPFEFTRAMDPALKAPTSMIPFGSNDYYCFVAQEGIVQLVAIPDATFDSLALRLVYDPKGENPVYSDFLNIVGSGVDGVSSDESGIVTGYYDMQGRSVSNPGEGMWIRVKKMSDGSLRHEKVILK